MKNFIDPEQLNRYQNVILLDVRFDFTDPSRGFFLYEKEHLSGALYLDLERDLSSSPDGQSGQHPLPEAENLKRKLEEYGAFNHSVFVIYDDGSNSTAGRGWFILKYFGLERVLILNGGLPAAKKAGYATGSGVSRATGGGKLTLDPSPDFLASYEEVLQYTIKPSPDTILIDSRAETRFLGLEENRYSVAGHIPGAKNFFYSRAYDETGRLLPEKQLREHFAVLFSFPNRIVSCGSGVTAAANMAAMDEIGLSSRLYPGSFSQWLEKGNPVE